MENAQKKVSEAQLKATKKYANSKWRPNIFIDADKREIIENWLKDNGYKSINEYLLYCLVKDGVIKT